MSKRYIPARFNIPVETQLRELQRRKMAEPAAKEIMTSLGLLFAYSPEIFSDSIKRAVINNVQRKMPASFEAWKQNWKG